MCLKTGRHIWPERCDLTYSLPHCEKGEWDGATARIERGGGERRESQQVKWKRKGTTPVSIRRDGAAYASGRSDKRQ
jgi:hypothetical protein